MNVFRSAQLYLKSQSHAMPRQLTSNRSSIGGDRIRVLEARDAASEAISRAGLHK